MSPMANAMNLRLLLGSALLLAAACATSSENVRPGQAQLDELDQLRAMQHVFRQQNTTPVDFNFPKDGRVTVREVSLEGWPGGEYVKCRFHYQNRTKTPIVKAWVSLDVLNARDEIVSSQAVNCIIPIPLPIERGAYYSDELRTPTYGAHLQRGWKWRIRCTAVPETEEEPLDPPVEEYVPRVLPPMVIRNRGQNDG